MDIEVKFDQDVVDLAPSADAAVMWWFDLTTNCATWMPGMAGLLGVPDDAAVEIRSRLMTLPGDTVVRTGHGADTTIGAEVCHVA